jgi:hypothetical protein
MSESEHLPVWLLAAAVVLAGQALALFAADPSMVRAAAVAVAVIVVSCVLIGSRVAWTIALVGALGQAGQSAKEPWALAVGVIAAICLLVPASLRFIWRQRSRRGLGSVVNMQALRDGVKRRSYGLVSRLAQWDAQEPDVDRPRRARRLGVLIWRLGVFSFFLLLLVGATYNWQHGSGEGSTAVDVIASVTWISYAVVQLAFIGVVIVALYQQWLSQRISMWLSRSRGHHQP